MTDSEFRRYQVPTHLRTEDQLTIGWFTFTIRQLTVLVLGGGAAYEVWTQFPRTALAFLLGDSVTTGVQIGCVALLVPFTLALAFVRRRGRTLEAWCFVWLNYRLQPRCYGWRRQPDSVLSQQPARAMPAPEESEDE
jgi:hypothetical protein